MGKIKGQNVEIRFENISYTLFNEIGKGDARLLEARKYLSQVTTGYSEAISLYNSVVPTAQKYLEMAKSLQSTEMITSLTKVISQANAASKEANSQLQKIKAI